MKVRFTKGGRRQFLAAIQYVADENRSAAERFRLRAEKRLRPLEQFPNLGRRLPEFPELPHRELIIRPYRFFYRVQGSTVWNVAVWHGAQIPKSPAGGARRTTSPTDHAPSVIFPLCAEHRSRITLDRSWRIGWGDDCLHVVEAHPPPPAGLPVLSTSKVRGPEAWGEGQIERKSRRDVERGSENARRIKRSELPDLLREDAERFALAVLALAWRSMPQSMRK